MDGDRMMTPSHRLAPDLRGEFAEDVSMAKHCTWRAGGRARYAYRPADLADLAEFFRVRAAMLREAPPFFVGLGSNLLVRDGGLNATVIFTHPGLGSLRLGDESEAGISIVAEAGAAAPKLARFAANHDVAAAEFFAGIPGTVGGALTMNAGCYGSETWNHVRAVQTIGLTGALEVHERDVFDIGYRHLRARRFELGKEAWFVAAVFEFPRGDGHASRERIKEMLARRVASQPLQLPNAGSVFRNPPGDFAARLIESCGLKGFHIGGASVSEKHANFIVNPQGRASAAEIEGLIDEVRAKVKTMTGIELHPEVRIVGEKVSQHE